MVGAPVAATPPWRELRRPWEITPIGRIDSGNRGAQVLPRRPDPQRLTREVIHVTAFNHRPQTQFVAVIALQRFRD